MQNNNRKPSAIERFLLHIHPVKIDTRALKFNKTFGLGGISALLFTLLVISGILLRFNYIPTPEKAYNSIIYLQNQVMFGRLLRNIHYISSLLLLVVSFLHLVRVYYSQSIYGIRAKNWIYGLLLFFIILFSNFTGYLLPWDQLAYWAVTVMTGLVEYIPLLGEPLATLLRGGSTVSGATLLNFYNLHTGILPMLMVFMLAMHFWLVRKAKGVLLPASDKAEKVNVYPNLVSREIMVALVVLAAIFLLSIFVNAPLQDKASITISPNPSKAPWYFMGVQELLLHIHPVVAVFIIPVLLLIFFFKLPYIKYTTVNYGVYFNSKKGKQANLVSAIGALIITFILIFIYEYVFKFSMLMPTIPMVLTFGILPFLMYVLPVGLLLYAIKKKFNLQKNELVMVMVTIIIVSYIVMMFVGHFLRGENMHLAF